MWAHPSGWEVAGMNLTAHRLTAAAGLCAATAGALYAGVQIHHPPADVAHVVTTEMTIRESAKALMCVLSLAGFTGLFVRHRRRFGALGLAGYVLLCVGYLAMFANQCIVACVLPVLAHTNPGYVQAYLDAAMGQTPGADIGHVQQLFIIAGVGYSFGGLLFGIALFRAGVLARWASALFAYGTVSALALKALPESFARPFAVPVGIALIGLGVALWRDQRRAPETASAPAWVAAPATR
jgi:hypothetical protein